MFYVLDENNNKVEAYDKQGVLALLEQAIADGDLESIAADSAFVDKLKCCVGTGTHHIAFITQAKYNELQANGQLLEDAYYFITDDTTSDDINTQLENLSAAVNSIQTTINDLSAVKTQIIDFTDGFIYDSSQATQPRVAITLLEGKTRDDIIAIQGSVQFNNDLINIDFSTLFSSDLGLSSNCNAARSSYISGNLSYRLFNFTIGIDTSNQFYCSNGGQYYDLVASSGGSLSKIKLVKVNIIYK